MAKQQKGGESPTQQVSPQMLGGMDNEQYHAAVALQVAIRDATGLKPSVMQALIACRMLVLGAEKADALRLTVDPIEFFKVWIDNDNKQRETARLAAQKEISAQAGKKGRQA